MNIALIFNKDREDTTGIYYERTFSEFPHRVDHFWTKDARSIKPVYDLYIRIDHGDYKYDIPDYLHPSVFLAIDTHLKKPYKKIRKQARHYDLVLCTQKEGSERLSRQLGVPTAWLSFGCDPEILKKQNLPKIYDIGFVGTDGKKSLRKPLLQKLSLLYQNSFIGHADYRKMSEIYSSARIGFNYSINNDINMRIFEIMSCGTMLLTNRIKDNGMEDLFVDGRHLVVYESPQHLFELVDYYLTHDEERQHIADCGYELVRKYHTYRHRVGQMLEIIQQHLF